MTDRWPVILLPGGILPAATAYRDLLPHLGDVVDARVKDLEVYATEQPPTDYSLETEVSGVARFATDAGFDRFHLVGYSGGGAVSLATIERIPERLLSLSVIEPAFAGWQRIGPEERTHMEGFRAIARSPDIEMMPAFQRAQIAADVELPQPPPGPPPAWMAKRPLGLRAVIAAFFAGDLDLDASAQFDRPVYCALGGRSHPDYFARSAERLATVFPDFTLEVFLERHHFDPPHRREPERLARSLRAQWARAARMAT